MKNCIQAIKHFSLQVGIEFGKAIEYESEIDPKKTKTTIPIENLEPGANYKIQFSVSMYEGTY